MIKQTILATTLILITGVQTAIAEVPDFIKEGKYYTLPGGFSDKLIKVEKIDHDWLYIKETRTSSSQPPVDHYFWVYVNSDKFSGIMPCDDENISEQGLKACAGK